jgi:VWFA-related protein
MRTSPGPAIGAALVILSAVICAGGQDPPRFSEKVDVSRILLDVRAIDRTGRAQLGLQPSDFEVKIDGRSARVESVEHVAGSSVVAPAGDSVRSGTVPQPAAAGRTVVFLFQKHLDRSRIPGLLLMLRELRRRLDAFVPEDRVAIFRFDARLQLLLDFTADKERVRAALEHDVLFAGRNGRIETRVPSLRAALDRERGTPSFSMERSLLRIAEVLAPLPGAKSVVVVGHGFGQLGTGGVTLDPEYEDARAALQRARTSVFCLDVTNADYHSLEAGLRTVAEDTGGLYERTHEFSGLALGRVLAALDGHYVLFVEKPAALRPGSHRLDVRLKGRDALVLAPATYVN